jgi:hypothetical protein
MGASELLLEVSAGGDPLREERLTRDLHNVLQSDQALVAAGVSVVVAPAPPAPPGVKGSFEAVLTLMAAGAPYAQPAADVLRSAIEKWCSRDRRVTVRLRDGERSVDVVGDPTPEQEALIKEFWRQSDDSSSSS